MKNIIRAKCPHCGNECKQASAQEIVLEDNDYIFFSCDECGTDFFCHTEMEIEHHAQPEATDLRDARD